MSTFSKTFTEQEKIDIRTSYKQAKDPKKQITILAELYACEESAIRDVVSGPDIVPAINLAASVSTRSRHKWTDEDIATLLSLRAEGVSVEDLATRFGVSTTAVRSRLALQKRASRNSERSYEIKTVNLPYVIPSPESDVEVSQPDTCCSSAIALLKEFQSIVSEANKEFNALAFGIALGKLACKVDELLAEVDKNGQ